MKSFKSILTHIKKLNKDSLVIDVGGYNGNFTQELRNLFNCYIVVFEPNPQIFESLRKRFQEDKKVKLSQYALSDVNKKEKLYLRGVGSSLNKEWAGSDEYVVVDVKKTSEILEEYKIDLLKLNCEGSEFNIIEDLYKNNLFENIEEILVQFHPSGIANKKHFYYENTIKRLEQYYKCIYRHKWEVWTKK